MSGKNLYITATPIGNLKDITLRALEILKSVDLILCEDTRHTKRLLDRYEISKKTISLHQHSSEKKIEQFLNQYSEIAYVCDAGTPGISDPGKKLVEVAVEAGVKVIPIPGACAFVAALSASGLPMDKFSYLGFMPHKGRNKMMEAIQTAKRTIVFYDSPHRILKTLEQLKEYLDLNRKVVVCRELTKKFESIYRGNIDEVLEQVKQRPKGEFTIVISRK